MLCSLQHAQNPGHGINVIEVFVQIKGKIVRVAGFQPTFLPFGAITPPRLPDAITQPAPSPT